MAKRDSARQQILSFVRAARDQGFRVDEPRGRDGTYRVYGKDGEGIVTMHSTPSDPRGPRNARGRLRRIGVKL